MPRVARTAVGGICYHVVNRGNRRERIFHDRADYIRFLTLLGEATERSETRLLAYCLMPNHFHAVLWPRLDGELSRWLQRLLTLHVRRHHARYGTSGRVWQGRSKTYPIQQDSHLLTVLRYVERNPVRASLVDRAERWEWSSLKVWLGASNSPRLDAGPLSRDRNWLDFVNRPQSATELAGLRECSEGGRPFGDSMWVERTIEQLGLARR